MSTECLRTFAHIGKAVSIVGRRHINPIPGKLKAWDHDHWSIEVPVAITLDKADPANYDALVIPGGVLNPDKMRENSDYVQFAAHSWSTVSRSLQFATVHNY